MQLRHSLAWPHSIIKRYIPLGYAALHYWLYNLFTAVRQVEEGAIQLKDAMISRSGNSRGTNSFSLFKVQQIKESDCLLWHQK
ncbi:MAG TPA: hypothetical protein PKD90_01580 [Phnomibacter sp.]|nr:hypothetical protein [Phnomibacter sp.]